MSIVQKIQALYCQKKATFSLAESCTGGAIAAELVFTAGASAYFLGGIVAYHEELKHRLLHVPLTVMKEKGVVSQEVAIWMAKGSQKMMRATASLSITGLAGPSGGTSFCPTGRVCLAFYADCYQRAWTNHFQGDRACILAAAKEYALDKILQCGEFL